MRIRGFIPVFAAVFGMILSTTASAQYSDEGVSKINIKLGVHRIMGSDDRSLLGGTWYTQEAIYDFKTDESGHPVRRATLGYFSSGSSGTGSMLTANVSNLWWKDTSNGNSFYGGGSVGAYKMKLFGEDSIKPGAQIFGGYAFGAGYFAELRMTLVPSWDVAPNLDVNMSGITLSLGTRQLF